MTYTCNSCLRDWHLAPKAECQRKDEHRDYDPEESPRFPVRTFVRTKGFREVSLVVATPDGTHTRYYTLRDHHGDPSGALEEQLEAVPVDQILRALNSLAFSH